MHHLLPPWPLYLGFILASLVLAITPGPAVLYIVTRSLVQGRRSGLASVVGVALGNLGNAMAAAVGLAAIFAVSAVAFTVVKFAGALYLVSLGLQALRDPRTVVTTAAPAPAAAARVFRDGFLVALLNPKTTIFFAAFLPQFMTSATPTVAQTLALAVTFIVVAALTDSMYALAASSLGPTLSRAGALRSLGRYFSAAMFFGLATFTVLSGSRGAK
jgi:threonine/homoserine/homoserine lactone efflux protein